MTDDVDEIAEQWGLGETEPKPAAAIHELKPKKEQAGKPPYVALTTKDKVYAFTIVSPSRGIEYSFFYHNLLQIVVNAPQADFVSVMTSSAIIRIFGRSLRPIASALKLRTCESVTEYLPEWFLQPTDQAAPFVEAVEVTTPVHTLVKQEKV